MIDTLTNRLPLVATLGVALATAVVLLALPSSAFAATQEQLVRDCLQQGYVDPGKYSREELQRGLDGLPSDISEYTDCYDVIADALDAKRRKGAAGSGQSTSGSGSGAALADRRDAPSTPEEVAEQGKAHNEIESTLLRPAPKVAVGGKEVVPELAGAKVARAGNDLPLPILLSLLAVALTLAAGALLVLWRRVPALRRMLGRGPAA